MNRTLVKEVEARAKKTVRLRNLTDAPIVLPVKIGNKTPVSLAPDVDTEVPISVFHASGGDTGFAEQIAQGNVCVVHEGLPAHGDHKKQWQDAKAAKEAARKVKPVASLAAAPVATPAKPEEK